MLKNKLNFFFATKYEVPGWFKMNIYTVKIKKGRKGVVAHERLTEPRVTMECLLAKPRSFSNLPTFQILMV